MCAFLSQDETTAEYFYRAQRRCRNLGTLIVEDVECTSYRLLRVAIGMLTLQAAGLFVVPGMGQVDAAVW